MSEVLLYRLKKNRTAILEDLEADQVIDYLYQEDVLDNDKYEDVRDEKSRRKQAALLLSYVEQDSCAIQKMVDCLQKSSQPHLASILNEPLPNEVNLSKGVLKQYDQDSPNYPMRHVPCGFAVIINNRFEEKATVHGTKILLDVRDGSETDVVRMEELFKWLQFEVVVHEDKTADEIISIVRQYTVGTDHDHYDCFVLFLMSHGFEDGIYGSDGKPVYLRTQIRKYLIADMCCSLANKPKLIFVQACRGQDADKGYVLTDSPSQAEPAPKQETNSITPYTPSNLDLAPNYNGRINVGYIPQDADIMITYASTANHAAVRNVVTGGWFVTQLYKVMYENAKTEDLQSMITKVTDEVAKERCVGSQMKPLMQCPELTGNLRKKLFFKPKS